MQLYLHTITLEIAGRVLYWQRFAPDVDTARQQAEAALYREYSGAATILDVQAA